MMLRILGSVTAGNVVDGTASTGAESWRFRYPALAGDETVRLIAWLRATAQSHGDPMPRVASRVAFTEPNLALESGTGSDSATELRVELDLDFRAPSDQLHRRVGDPTVLRMNVTPEEFVDAADSLEADLLRFSDGLRILGGPRIPEDPRTQTRVTAARRTRH